MKTNLQNRPNILLISIDSLRADHLSLYGYKRETTPFLSELAFDGLIFENAFAASNWTGASVSSLLTGLYPISHGFGNQRYYLDDGKDTLASILSAHGYFTIGFSNNMYLSGQTGMDAGFQDFRYRGHREKNAGSSMKKEPEVLRKLKGTVSERNKHYFKNLLDSCRKSRALARDDGACETETAFGKWLSSFDRQSPFFAYIHYQEPHSIYMPPYHYRRRFFSGSWEDEADCLTFDHVGYYGGKTAFTETQVQRYLELYDGEICYLDWRLGRLFQLLKNAALFENTVIIVTADHGEMFGEHNFFWHAFCLYDPLIRIPLIIRYPEWFERDQRSLEIVQATDIVPTILDGVCLEWKHAGERHGQSFLRGSKRQAALTEVDNPEIVINRWLLRNKELKVQDFAHYFRDLTALRTATDKLIFASDGAHEFYDLHRDPSESTNLFGTDDARIAQRRAELESWRAALTPHAVSTTTQPGFDKETWEKMRALGYA
jgi:arylsulfatase A-like enzyme